MNGSDLWSKYCNFYEKDFSEQMEYNKKLMDKHFNRWKQTDLAKILRVNTIKKLDDVPVTKYSDYDMLAKFGRRITEAVARTPRRPGELYREYYDRVSRDIGATLDPYMAEPYHLCMKTTGTTGQSKWVAHGETYWRNFALDSMASAVIACSNGWGDTELKKGDKILNISAPVPYISGWGAVAYQTQFELVPPVEVTDNLEDMRQKFFLMLKALRKSEKIALGGGIGSMFYMICKYLVEPEEFYNEYYRSMNFGLKKMLLYLKLLQCKLSSKEKKEVTDYIPLKGIIIGGTEAKLYIDFFKKEFGLEPLHAYGSTEAGGVMRGEPDRKTDLLPNLRTAYFEFKTDQGEIRRLDELRKGEVYDLVVSPFGSIVFRYDMEDMFRVVDFKDDGMPVFAFEGRKVTVIDIYGYRLSPNVIAQALYKAGLRLSDKWAVVKLFKPREHLQFVLEKTWSYSEEEAGKIIFRSLVETEKEIPRRGRTLKNYIEDFGIEDPSELVKVEYLRDGAFLRYSMLKAKSGSPIGQYKPPKIIPAEKMDVYETLRSA